MNGRNARRNDRVERAEHAEFSIVIDSGIAERGDLDFHGPKLRQTRAAGKRKFRRSAAAASGGMLHRFTDRTPPREVPFVGEPAALAWFHRLNGTVAPFEEDAFAVWFIGQSEAITVLAEPRVAFDEFALIQFEESCQPGDVRIVDLHESGPTAAVCAALAFIMDGAAHRIAGTRKRAAPGQPPLFPARWRLCPPRVHAMQCAGRMEFEITHTTSYSYEHPAAEAYGEARLTPPNLPTQQVLSHRLEIDPATRTSDYIDHFGNAVNFFSLPYRHRKLLISNFVVVRTLPQERPASSLELSIGEARQIFSSALPDVFDYLHPSEIVQTGNEAVQWAKRFLPAKAQLGEGLQRLNEAIHESFSYTKGATDNSTALAAIWKERKGVCQDFAHVALSILRTAGLPARYVCGYIEAEPPKGGNGQSTRRLVGAVATHAWVEVLVPGMKWVAFDPTNRQWVDERYVTVSIGRDSRDATPLRGTFKGSGNQNMAVKVFVRRRNDR
jgi:transglutaminase-like putative cysteine protease